MRRQDKEAWPRGARPSDIIYKIDSTCARQTHVIRVRRDGNILFDSHGCMSIHAILTDGRMRGWEHRGCYYFAKILIQNKSGLHVLDFKEQRRRGRTIGLRDLAAAGLSPSAALYYSTILERWAGRVKSKAGPRDPYAKPFAESHYSRIMPFYAARRKKEDMLLGRLVDKLRERGVEPEAYWNRPLNF